jgi:hypothetical protein
MTYAMPSPSGGRWRIEGPRPYDLCHAFAVWRPLAHESISAPPKGANGKRGPPKFSLTYMFPIA